MVSVLFARSGSIYSTLGCDVWDVERDARLWLGRGRIIAHPPCRAWGKYSARAKPRPGERELAIWAVHQVRAFGGVLEHPLGSGLWREMHLPPPDGLPDHFGGYTIACDQGAYGHRATKPTLLYLAGVDRSLIGRDPPTPPARTTVERMCRAEREATPEPFARFLIRLASS